MSATQFKQIILAYIPVIHRGYLDLAARFPQARIGVLGSGVLAQFDQLRKDLRALEPEMIVEQLKASLPGRDAWVVTEAEIAELVNTKPEIIMPDEDIMHDLAKKYFGSLPAANLKFESAFLRWDKQKTLAKSQINPDDTISQTEFDPKMMALANQEATNSADWWRQVGGVIVKDNQVVAQAHNHHLPDDYQLAYAGDPRGNFHKGEHIYLATAAHVESSLVAQAAKAGISLQGADIYVTTFPCPYCAKVLAETGLRRLYYRDGYSMVDGAEALKAAGVEIVRVASEPSQSSI